MNKTGKLLLSLFFTITIKGFANCSYIGFGIWPNSPVISQNPIFIINFRSNDRILKDLDSGKLYLYSSGQEVPIRIEKTHHGTYSVMQILIKPLRLLDSGRTYELRFQLPGMKPRSKIPYFSFASWTVTTGTDTIVPAWKSKPRFLCKHMSMYGCGDEAYMVFCGRQADTSKALFLVQLKKIGTAEIYEYYLSDLEVGRGMCGGAFDFTYGWSYDVSFSLVDMSGNHGPFTKPIRIKAPGIKDQVLNGAKTCSCNMPNTAEDWIYVESGSLQLLNEGVEEIPLRLVRPVYGSHNSLSNRTWIMLTTGIMAILAFLYIKFRQS